MIKIKKFKSSKVMSEFLEFLKNSKIKYTRHKDNNSDWYVVYYPNLKT